MYDFDGSTMHPKFNPTKIRTYDLEIIVNTFLVPESETLALTTEPSGPLQNKMHCHIILDV